MNPVNFPESNKVYKKPADMTDEQCSDLNVYEQEGLRISCWELTNSELLVALFTKKIWLQVMMNVQPPVSLSTADPFAVGNLSDTIEDVVARLIDRRVVQFMEKKRMGDNAEGMKESLREFATFLITTTKPE